MSFRNVSFFAQNFALFMSPSFIPERSAASPSFIRLSSFSSNHATEQPEACESWSSYLVRNNITSCKVMGSASAQVIHFSLPNPQSHNVVLRFTLPLTETSTTNLSDGGGVKVRMTTSPLSTSRISRKYSSRDISELL